MELTTAYLGNTKPLGGLSPASWSPLSDGLSSFTSERVKGLDKNITGFKMSNVNIEPVLTQTVLTVKFDENSDEVLKYKAFYVTNPAKNNRKVLAKLFKEEDESLEEVHDIEGLELKGIGNNPYQLRDIDKILGDLIETSYKELQSGNDINRNDLVSFLTKVMDLSVKNENGEIITTVRPNVENIEELSLAMQKAYKALSEKTRESFNKKLIEESKEKETKIPDLLKKLDSGEFNLTPDDISYIDVDSLFKLSDYYINQEAQTYSLLHSDILMAKRLRELNPQIVSARTLLTNYYLTGTVPNQGVVVFENEAIRKPSFYEEQETIKNTADKILAKMNKNFDKFKKEISKEDANAFRNMMAVLYKVRDSFIPYTPVIEDKNLTPEEYRERINEIKEEIKNNEKLKENFNNVMAELQKTAELLEASQFVSPINKKLYSSLIEAASKQLNKGVDNDTFMDIVDELKNATQKMIVALKAYQNSMYNFKLKDSIQITSDMSRVRSVPASAVIPMEDIKNLRYSGDGYERYAVIAFSAKEVGKEKATFGITGKLMGIYDTNGNVATPYVGSTIFEKIAFKVQQINENANKLDNSTEMNDEYKKRFSQDKSALLTLIETAGTIKGSKLFKISGDEKVNKEYLKDLKQSIKNAKTYTEIVEIIKNAKSEDLKSALELPDLMLANYGIGANKEDLKTLLEQGEQGIEELSPKGKNKFLNALSTWTLYEAIRRFPEVSEEEKNDRENNWAGYAAYTLSQAIEGRILKKDNNRLVFAPLPMIGNFDKDSVAKVINKAGAKVVVPQKIKEHLFNCYGVRYTNETQQRTNTLNDIQKYLTGNKQGIENSEIAKAFKNGVPKADEVEENAVVEPPKPKETEEVKAEKEVEVKQDEVKQETVTPEEELLNNEAAGLEYLDSTVETESVFDLEGTQQPEGNLFDMANFEDDFIDEEEEFMMTQKAPKI